MTRLLVFAVFLALLAPIYAHGDESDWNEFPYWVQEQMAEKSVPATVTGDVPRPKTTAGWAELIDETWGPGLSTAEKLSFFDTFWHTIDREFACFQDLDVDWDGLRDLYRPEVLSGVSKGRFAAIMGRLSLALMEAHTAAYDRVVQWRTPTEPGVPLLVVGAWAQIIDFGACLTPLPDRSLLVYQALPDHPMDLVPGDVVLGYDGRPWSELWPEMLGYGLPVTGFWGSSSTTYEHGWLMAAGANWHLFETIDILRHATGEIVHLPTSSLVGWQNQSWCTEQIPVPGVAFPDYAGAELFSWGLIEGTGIGYIYGWGWGWDAEEEFRDAVDALMHDHETDGLIIDFRFNLGGNMFLSDAGLALLFDRPVPTIDWVSRCVPEHHLGLCSLNRWPEYVIPGDPDTGYQKPIAVLVGPGAVSSGDQVALRMKFHPRTRFFGKSTNTAFNAAALMVDDYEWRATYAFADAYLLSNPGEYLTHDELRVDVPVWLEPDDVAAGRDTVVEAAIEWIQNAHLTPRRTTGRRTP